MTEEWFRVEYRTDGVLCLCGELDATVVDELATTIRQAGTPVRLDLSAVSFIDSTALHVLLAERQRLGAALSIVEPSRVVRRLLELTGLTDLLLGVDVPPPPE